MDSNLTLEICYDMDLIKELITDPYVWDKAAEDGLNANDFFPGQDAFTIWLLCYDGDTIVGIILLHTDTSVSLKLHIYMIKEHEKRGRKMMMLFYRWFIENTTSEHVSAFIPKCFQKTINFAKKVGMRHEGLMRNSYKKNGVLYGQEILGITKKEAEALI